jgi:DNA-3-methyladenine glycosylase II
MAPSPKTIKAACQTLVLKDLVLARAYAESGIPIWRAAPAQYETLARAVVYQLISTKAAAAIWQRLLERHRDMSPEAILADDPEALKGVGLSRPKVSHLRTIAEAIITGRLDFDRLAAAPIGMARKELLAVKGIGPWTADIFLMNALGKLDAFPVGDVGLMEAYKQLSGVENRPDIKAFSVLADEWRPYRGVAAHLLYGWLNMTRDRNAASLP